jgi:hypothetical protein
LIWCMFQICLCIFVCLFYSLLRCFDVAMLRCCFDLCIMTWQSICHYNIDRWNQCNIQCTLWFQWNFKIRICHFSEGNWEHAFAFVPIHDNINNCYEKHQQRSNRTYTLLPYTILKKVKKSSEKHERDNSKSNENENKLNFELECMFCS